MDYKRFVGILGIAILVATLVTHAGWLGAVCGLALVGLANLVPLKPTDTEGNNSSKVQRKVTATLDQVPGITAAHPRDFEKALPIMTLKDGSTLRTWKNPVGVDHVFLADPRGQMIYGAYVGWIHNQGLQHAIAKIRRDFS